MSDNGNDINSWIRSALDEYEGPLLRYAHRIIGDLDRARDVVQETFLRLIKANREELNGRLSQWLFTVCRNQSLDVRRKETRMTTLNEPTIAESPTSELSPDDHAALHDESQQVASLLNDLPDNQQEVIRLKFQNSMSYRQIAEVTGLSVTNVGFLLHTGLKTLRLRASKLQNQ